MREETRRRCVRFALLLIAASVSTIAMVVSCSEREGSLDEQISLLRLQTLPEMTHPSTNPYSLDAVKLGKMLFYDPIMSGEKDIACVSCHYPSLGYADAIDLSIGSGGRGLGSNRVRAADKRIPLAIRNSSTVVNTGYNGLTNYSQDLDELFPPMTWAVIYRPLEAQTFGALGNRAHMRGDAYSTELSADSLVVRLRKIQEYVNLFDRAFGGGMNAVKRENIGKAIAQFERSLVSRNSAYDRYAMGEKDALTDQQKRGLVLFFGKANCANCHLGPMFSDFSLYNLGINSNSKLALDADLGNSGKNLYRTPSLRNVVLTAPYMHNGTISSLRDVVEYYNKGVSENPAIPTNQISDKIKPLHLSNDESEAIVAFLHALTDDSYDKTILTDVPSGFKSGGY